MINSHKSGSKIEAEYGNFKQARLELCVDAHCTTRGRADHFLNE